MEFARPDLIYVLGDLESSSPPADNANFAIFVGRLREWCETCCVRVIPSLALGFASLLWVVANRANFAVLTQDLGEMCGNCSRAEQISRHPHKLLANPAKSA